jgi:hypothetical protein
MVLIGILQLCADDGEVMSVGVERMSTGDH